LPSETQHPEEKFVATPAAERYANLRDAEIGAAIEEHWLELPGGRMRYLKAGSGPALILIHGLMGYSFSWRFTIPALAPHATVYAIDNLGAGLSTANDDMDCTVRATAERVLQFADALGIKDFDLLGTSHGGAVAIMVAAVCAERNVVGLNHLERNHVEQNDTRLQRLVLVAPVNPWSPHGKRFAPFWAALSVPCSSATRSRAGAPSTTYGCAACSATDQEFRPIRSRATAYPWSRIARWLTVRASYGIGRQTSRNWKRRFPKYAITPLSSSGERKTAPSIFNLPSLCAGIFAMLVWWRSRASATFPMKRRPRSSTVR